MPSCDRLRIATRASKLAQVQANSAQLLLQKLYPQISIEMVRIVSEGDRIQGPLAEVGGKELFITALHDALENDIADCACHSLKDVGPADTTFTLAAYLRRADARDALLGMSLAELEEKDEVTIATSSPRRTEMMALLVPHATLVPMRGNVDTRLAKLARGEADAMVLACAGLARLGLEEHITERFDPSKLIPAAGQGTIVLECRSDRPEVAKLLYRLNDEPSQLCAIAERSCAATIAGDCHTPLGAYAQITAEGNIAINCALTLQGSQACGHATEADPCSAGKLAAQMMLANGGKEILKKIKYPKLNEPSASPLSSGDS